MMFEKLIHYFAPPGMHKLHPDYDEVRTITSGMITAGALLIILPIPLFYFSELTIWYYAMAAMCVITLLTSKYYGIYRSPLMLTFALSYYVLVNNAIHTGGIFSAHVTSLYMLMLTGFWANRKIGLFMIPGNMIALVIIYYSNTLVGGDVHYALVLHFCLTIFFGMFFLLVQQQHEAARIQVREQQHIRIDQLNKAVKERTRLLSTMRQNLASDFHDETGNMLAAITRQAGVLKLKMDEEPAILPIVDNIISNSEHLYASSRDFLWSINHNSDDPHELFAYLTAFGQVFYNQFDMAFSVRSTSSTLDTARHLEPFAARHIIFIFKEAMTNAARHSGAKEVILEMAVHQENITMALHDDGCWQIPDTDRSHTGLSNMSQRSDKNNFKFNVYSSNNGTRIQLDAPTHFIHVE